MLYSKTIIFAVFVGAVVLDRPRDAEDSVPYIANLFALEYSKLSKSKFHERYKKWCNKNNYRFTDPKEVIHRTMSISYKAVKKVCKSRINPTLFPIGLATVYSFPNIYFYPPFESLLII